MNQDLPVTQPASIPHRIASALFGAPDAGELERSLDPGADSAGRKGL